MGDKKTKAPDQQAAPASDAPEAGLVAESGGTMDAPVPEPPAEAEGQGDGTDGAEPGAPAPKGPRVETHGGVRWVIFK